MVDFLLCLLANLFRIYLIDRFIQIFWGNFQERKEEKKIVFWGYYVVSTILFWNFHFCCSFPLSNLNFPGFSPSNRIANSRLSSISPFDIDFIRKSIG